MLLFESHLCMVMQHSDEWFSYNRKPCCVLFLTLVTSRKTGSRCKCFTFCADRGHAFGSADVPDPDGFVSWRSDKQIRVGWVPTELINTVSMSSVVILLHLCWAEQWTMNSNISAIQKRKRNYTIWINNLFAFHRPKPICHGIRDEKQILVQFETWLQMTSNYKWLVLRHWLSLMEKWGRLYKLSYYSALLYCIKLQNNSVTYYLTHCLGHEYRKYS